MKKQFLATVLLLLFSVGLFAFPSFVYAQNTASIPSEGTSTKQEEDSSPWLITPIISSDPKISTAGGALVGYVHQFDEKSPPSLIGVVGTYSTTNSWYAGAFAQTYFGEDMHRFTTAYIQGEIKNDYEDFLGSGQRVQQMITLLFLQYDTPTKLKTTGIWVLSLYLPTMRSPEMMLSPVKLSDKSA